MACDGGDAATAEAAEAAVVAAREMVGTTLDSLPPKNSADGGRFQRWFGGAEGDYDPTVREIYGGILASLAYSWIWCPNMSTPAIDPGTLAWVPGDATGEMFLRSGFFELGTSGADSQAATIIHEASHLSAVADVVDTDVDGDGDKDYGTASAERLASKHPAAARRTADNIQYYAEDTSSGIP